MSNYYKPQTPLVKGDDFIYPLTTYDQVIMSDGSRFNIIDDLESTSTTKALSANQGRALKNVIDGKAEIDIGSLTLSVGNWSNMSQSVSASGVTMSNTVIVVPSPENYTTYHECGIYCSAQGTNTLTFTTTEQPTADLSVQFMIIS